MDLRYSTYFFAFCYFDCFIAMAVCDTHSAPATIAWLSSWLVHAMSCASYVATGEWRGDAYRPTLGAAIRAVCMYVYAVGACWRQWGPRPHFSPAVWL